MKLKRFFNRDTGNAFVSELNKDFKPILEKVTLPVTAFAKSNPGRTFFLMISIVIANILILFFFTDAFKTKKSMEIKEVKFQRFSTNGGTRDAAPNIAVSFENIKKVRAMQDTLNYLIALKHMTFQDTLTFVRVMDEFQKINSGSSGLPPVSLENLRKAGKRNDSITDKSIINK